MESNEADVSDSSFLGLHQQVDPYRAVYGEIIDSMGIYTAPAGSEKLRVVQNPTHSLTRLNLQQDKSPMVTRAVIGSGFESPYARIEGSTGLNILGVRGYLSLNRLPSIDERSAVVGDMALLAEMGTSASRKTHPLGIVRASTRPLPTELRRQVEALGAVEISFSSGLRETVNLISSCERILSDNVAGLAIADTLAIPNAWLCAPWSVYSSRFEVMDYFSGMERDLYTRVESLPKSSSGADLKLRTASKEIVQDRMEGLLRAFLKAHEIQVASTPKLVLDRRVPVTETEWEVPFGGNVMYNGAIELEYHYSGQPVPKEFLISFDLVSDDGTNPLDVPIIEGLAKSPNPAIGFYKYLQPDRGEARFTFPLQLPQGMFCRAIRLQRWQTGASEFVVTRVSVLPTIS